MKRIIIDMMGGDNAPRSTVKGVAKAKAEFGGAAQFVLVGDRDAILKAAQEHEADISGCEIVHTDVKISMEDEATSVIRSKSNSSMAIALRMLRDGAGDALVSAGNTGALFTGATLIVRRAKGVRRAAIATLLPFQPPVMLVDSGANVVCTPEYLVQFALMGSVYMKNVMGVENPRVGLLNNGAEEHKGTQLQLDTYKLLSEDSRINFVGNIEANVVMQNGCDVLVADGFTGNVFLKAVEGVGKMMLKTLKGMFYKNTKTQLAAVLVKNDLKIMKKNFDSGEMGGAPILGISKPVIKAHGGSNSKAIKNAIKKAITYSETDITAEIESFMETEQK